jgi:hypothetical protein
VRLYAGELGDLADLEIQLVREIDPLRHDPPPL